MTTSTKTKVASIVGLLAAGGATLFVASQPKCSDGNVVCVSWTASPGWINGDDPKKIDPYTPGTRVDYVVFRYDAVKNTGIPLVTTQALNAMFLNEPKGQQCYFVAAKVDNVQSDVVPKHPGVCIFVRNAAPTDGAIEAPTDGAIEEPRSQTN